jgi:hypothetical protein
MSTKNLLIKHKKDKYADIKPQTINRSDRDLGSRFNQVDINKMFEENDKKIEEERKFEISDDNDRVDEIVDKNLPHKKPVEDVILNIRELIHKIIELILNFKNPLPYIFSTPDRQFAFTVLIIVVGVIFLFLSNILKSSE